MSESPSKEELAVNAVLRIAEALESIEGLLQTLLKPSTPVALPASVKGVVELLRAEGGK